MAAGSSLDWFEPGWCERFFSVTASRVTGPSKNSRRRRCRWHLPPGRQGSRCGENLNEVNPIPQQLGSSNDTREWECIRNDTQEWESIPWAATEWESIPRAATEVEVYWAVYWAGRGRVPDAAARGDSGEARGDSGEARRPRRWRRGRRPRWLRQ